MQEDFSRIMGEMGSINRKKQREEKEEGKKEAVEEDTPLKKFDA